MRKNTNKFLFFAFVITILAGCASLPKADQSLINKYKTPVSVGEQETLIYVIRQDATTSALYPIWVSNNDKFVAELSRGSFVYFKVKAGINTVSLRQIGTPLGFMNVDMRTGETVFLFIDIKNGYSDFSKLFYELKSDIGKTIVMSYKEIKEVNLSEKSTDYLMGVMNPALYGMALMKNTSTEPEPDGIHATVTFLRPQNKQSFSQPLFPGIWSQNGFLGNIDYHKRFTVKLTSGKHVFLSNAKNNYSYMKADLLPGKKYYVIVDSSWFGTVFNPIKRNENNSKIKESITETSLVEVSIEMIDAKIRKRLDESMILAKQAIENMGKDDSTITVLDAKDGR